MNQSNKDRPAAARGRVSLEHQVFELSVYRSSGYESSSLTLLHETRVNRNAANSEKERMIEEEPQQQLQDIIEPEADGKSEESRSENVARIEAIPEIHESPCQQKSVPKQSLEDEESEGIGEDDEVKQDEKEEAEQPVKKTGKGRIIRKEVQKQNLRRELASPHEGTRRSNLKSKLRKREGPVRNYNDIDQIVNLYEKGVSSKEIHEAFGVRPSILNKWKNQNQAYQKEKGRLRIKHENASERRLEKFVKIRQNALYLYRQGMTVKQIASKMQIKYNTVQQWTQPFYQEVRIKYAEGLKIIETAILNYYQEGGYLLFNDIERAFRETFAGDVFLLGNKDWIFFTIKKLKLHQRYILIKAKNRKRVDNEEILENSRRLLRKYAFLRDSEEDKKQIAELHKQGKTLTQICSEVVKGEKTVRRLIEQIDEQNMSIEDNQAHLKEEDRSKMEHEDASRMKLDHKSKNCENFAAGQSSIFKQAVNLYRQGMTVKDIASKMFLNSRVVKYWTRPFIQEVKNKYAEGLKIIETALLSNFKSGNYLLFYEIEKVYQETFAGDVFLLGNKDWIFFTIKKLKLHQRYKLVKSRNWNRVEKEEIMEHSSRLLKKHVFLRNSKEDKEEIAELHRQGKMLTQISSQVGLSRQAVGRWRKQINEENAYFERKQHQSQNVYQEIVKDKRKGSSITKREIREYAHRHIADLTFLTVHGWVERFIEYFKLSERYEIQSQ